MDTDKKFLKQAVKQAKVSLKKGGFPAGAVLVKGGKIIAKGISIGNKLNDPTAHSETSVIRKACKKLKTTNLEGCVLYSSMEPCMMCFAASNWANVSKIIFACRKNEELVKVGCYESTVLNSEINQKNKHQMEMEFFEEFEDEVLKMIKEWEKSIIVK